MRAHIRCCAATIALLAAQLIPATGAGAQQAPKQNPAATKPSPPPNDLKPAFEALRAGDYAKAERILKPMAERNDIRAQFLLGAEVYGPLSPLKNLEKSIALLKDAAERGFPRAMAVYGGALADGAGVAQDKVEAYKFMALASRQKVPGIEAALASLSGELSDEELERAKQAADAFVPRK